MTDQDTSRLVTEFRAAHAETSARTAALAEARQRRRTLAARLRAAGRSYKWIGEQIGVSAQAVEGFVKYHERRDARRSARKPTSVPSATVNIDSTQQGR